MVYLRQIWFQVHWFIGITAGSLLLVIGVTGAVLSFRAEITDAINPQLKSVAAPAGAVRLSPAQLQERLGLAHPERRINTLTVFAQSGRPARVNFSPPPGARNGETRLVDPWTGVLLPEPVGEEFFEFVESVHRWLLLPRDTGKPVTGTLAAGLLVLALSGLYLRWPRRALAWRNWIRLDFALTGRAFLWNLHAVVGTLALLAYLVVAPTGIYWGFDAVRTMVDNAAGEGRMVRAQRMQGATAKPITAAAVATTDRPSANADLSRVWPSFLQVVGSDWSQVTLRLPARGAQQVEATYLRRVPEHDRARNRMYLGALNGEVSRHERYADKPMAGRLVNSIYPMHMGSYWGLPGRIVMTLSSVALALFSISGWMLYLNRRKTARAVAAQRAALNADTAAAQATASAAGGDVVLIAYASQTGHAESQALSAAAALGRAGMAVAVQPLSRLKAGALMPYQRALVIVSTFGEGDPPDSARVFARQFLAGAEAQLGQNGELGHLRYGLLALGDRHYARFCGFGRVLDHALKRMGAQPLFPMIEVDNGDAAALARWSAEVAAVWGLAADYSIAPVAQSAPYASWQLVRRSLLNPGSQGDPLYEVELLPPPGVGASWAAGALLELLPQHPAEAVERLGKAGTVQPLAPRRYSVASIAADGCVQLLVRQARHEDGIGVASGWLTAWAPLGAIMQARLQANPGFALVEGDGPCIFIGNGSGFAGLRGHLRERARRGFGRNWLVFGERQSAHDDIGAAEVAGWRAAGLLARADLVFSRDQAERFYVQDCLRKEADLLRQWVSEGAHIYVCGSLQGMAQGVEAALAEALGQPALDALVTDGRLRRDVY